MTRSKNIPAQAPHEARTYLVARLRDRAPEIKAAIFERISELSEPDREYDPVYVAGLKAAVGESFDLALADIERVEESLLPVGPELARQARRAAREGVGLDTVLRRIAAGQNVLEAFLMAEATDGVSSNLLCQISSEQGRCVDRLMKFVAAQYKEALEYAERSPAQREADRIVRLLANDSTVASPDLAYDFESWHLGGIISGPDAVLALHSFGKATPSRAICVPRDDETVWIWLGCPQLSAAADLERCLVRDVPPATSIAIGEPRRGLDGWRQTHHEARIALQVMLCKPRRVTRCRDVILDSAVIRDPRLALSLIETYLVPLDGRDDSGEVLRGTLRAYFTSDQNVSSAARALGVDRRTVERHLRKVETKLGQSLYTCSAQVQVALRAEELVADSMAIS